MTAWVILGSIIAALACIVMICLLLGILRVPEVGFPFPLELA